MSARRHVLCRKCVNPFSTHSSKRRECYKCVPEAGMPVPYLPKAKAQAFSVSEASHIVVSNLADSRLVKAVFS